MNYKMIVAYDGTRYNGWQKQGDTDNTIQHKIEAVLSEITSEQVDVHGAGRTDAGVHALGQCAQFRTTRDFDPEDLRKKLNRYLPDDIGILEISRAAERFHSRYNASSKIYTYRISKDMSRHVFDRRYVLRYEKPIDVAKMRHAASFLVGTHDFKSFCGNPRFKKSTVRTIYSIGIEETVDEVRIVYTGEGFLMYMVRIMTGTLLDINEGLLDPGSIPAILEGRDRKLAGRTAPPEGLVLTEVKYH